MTRRQLQRMVIGGVMLAVTVAAVGGGAYLTWLRTPPPMPDTIDEAVATFASPRYRRLPDTRRAAYVEHMRRLADDLPAEERAELWQRLRDEPGMRDAARQAMQDMMVMQARRFAFASPPERTAMLDAFITMSEGRRRPGGDDTQMNRRRNEARDRMQHYTQHGDPQNQAYMQEFWKAVRQRRTELGL